MFSGKRQRYLEATQAMISFTCRWAPALSGSTPILRADRSGRVAARPSMAQAGAPQARCHFSQGPSRDTERVLRKGHRLLLPAGSAAVVLQ